MVLAEQLPQQFTDVKDDSETFLWIGKPEFLPFICKGIPFLIFSLICGCCCLFFVPHIQADINIQESARVPFLLTFLFVALLPVLVSILNILRLVLVHENTFYALTNKRVMLRSGFWGIDFSVIDYDKISYLQVMVNPLENLFHVGTVCFSPGMLPNAAATLEDTLLEKGSVGFISIQNPYEVFKQVKTIAVDIKTDWNYPNKLRPGENPGYQTKYDPR